MGSPLPPATARRSRYNVALAHVSWRSVWHNEGHKMWFRNLVAIVAVVLAWTSYFTKGKLGWLMALAAVSLLVADHLLLG